MAKSWADRNSNQGITSNRGPPVKLPSPRLLLDAFNPSFVGIVYKTDTNESITLNHYEIVLLEGDNLVGNIETKRPERTLPHNLSDSLSLGSLPSKAVFSKRPQ